MKNILVAILLMVSTVTIAQKLGEQAIFKECKKEKLPAKCTQDKITADITALLTTPIINAIIKNNTKSFFTISVEFTSDENGNIIPSETGILCENNEALKTAINSYLTNLPLFIPKDKDLKERRSYTAINIMYIKNTDDKNYHIKDNREVMPPGDYRSFGPEKMPIYPGCEELATKAEKMDCLKSSITQFIAKYFVMPEVENEGQDKMFITMIITIDGKIRIEEIEGSSEPFRNEVYQVIKKIPKIKPAEEKGIPVAIKLTLPLTLNVH